MSTSTLSAFALQPRTRYPLYILLLFGAVLALCPLFFHFTLTALLLQEGAASGLVICVALYLFSPSWRFQVVLDQDTIYIRGAKSDRLVLPLAEIQEMVYCEKDQSCYLRGPDAAHSLLIPGLDGGAPYCIPQHAALVGLLADRLKDRNKECRRVRDRRLRWSDINGINNANHHRANRNDGLNVAGYNLADAIAFG